ncbi:MAG: FMN-binding negative transcriptional regulator [Paracoccaceae bacterium]
MHPNPIYRSADTAQHLAFAAARGFGMLAVNAPDGPLLSHIPFVLSPGGVDFHLVRSNPIARALAAGPMKAVLAVSGPDGYVSPDWYGLKDQVPTWNYLAVHLRGTLSLAPQNSLRAHLDALSETFETRLLPKPVWQTAKVAPDALARMLRQIVPVKLNITSTEATWKLSQNKPEAARQGVMEGLRTSPTGHELAALVAAMREVKGTG